MAKRLNIVEEKFLDTIKNNNLINSGNINQNLIMKL